MDDKKLMKICTKCKEEKELINFSKRKDSKDGYKNQCKICFGIIKKKYYENNLEKILKYGKQYRNDNSDKLKEKDLIRNKNEYRKSYQKENGKNYWIKNKELLSIRNKKYREDNIEQIKEQAKIYYNNNKNGIIKQYVLDNRKKINAYQVQKRKTDALFKLRCCITSNIYGAIKRQGYSKNTKTYQILGCTFEEFKQHLEKQFTEGMTWENQGQWHLDHIYPVSLAKDEQHLIQLNHYTNFQPLWAIDNFIKGNKII